MANQPASPRASPRRSKGEVVARKADGTPWDHVSEVKQTQRALTKRSAALEKKLGQNLTDAERSAVLNGLGEASRLLDHSRKYVP